VNRVASVLLVLLLQWQGIHSLALLVHYRWKLSYYSEVLCKNKESTSFRCNGRCALAAELNAFPQDEDPAAPARPEINWVNLLFLHEIQSTEMLQADGLSMAFAPFAERRIAPIWLPLMEMPPERGRDFDFNT
jgi:hypothetical protein